MLCDVFGMRPDCLDDIEVDRQVLVSTDGRRSAALPTGEAYSPTTPNSILLGFFTGTASSRSARVLAWQDHNNWPTKRDVVAVRAIGVATTKVHVLLIGASYSIALIGISPAVTPPLPSLEMSSLEMSPSRCSRALPARSRRGRWMAVERFYVCAPRQGRSVVFVRVF